VLGATFGYYLIQMNEMQWRMAQAKGEEPTLAASHPEFGLTVYPVHAVQKRIESRSAGFFEPIAAVLKDKLHELRS